MEIAITTRHFEAPGELREVVEKRLSSAIGKYFPRAVEANVILSAEKHRYTAEADVKIKGASFHARGEMRDLNGVIDEVMGKLETQMRRHKGRRKSRSKKGSLRE